MIGGASGLVFAFVVVLWVAYVVPLALRRYDEAATTSSLEASGALSRVIRRAVDREEQQPVPGPVPVRASVAPAPVRTLDRPAARLAARRRRRVLVTLLTLLVVVVAAAAAGLVPVAVVAAPVALVTAWLVACRVQVRGERGLRRPRASGAEAVPTPSVDDEDTIVITGLFEDVDPDRPHVMQDVPLAEDALDEQLAIAVPSVSVVTGEALWDPLPVTLPTYVTKPRAGRTVRTIDFGQPGAWTSGHVEGEDVELPGHPDEHHGDAGARAVGH